MKKRFFAIVICFILVLTASCSESSAVLLDFIDNTDTSLDLYGQDFWFYTHWEDNYHIMADQTTVPSRMLELKNDRVIKTEKEFNINFNFTINDPILRVSSGDGAYELIDNDLNSLYDYYKSGMLTPIEEISTIDLSSGKWGNANFIKYGIFNGKQYGIFPWNWNSPEATGAMMYNGSLVSSLGGTIPYEYQENGTWTWETFENELRKYPAEYNSIPLTALHTQEFEVLGFTALHSNNLRVIEGDETVGYTFGFNNNDAYATLDWLNSIYNEGLVKKGDMESFTVGNECVYYLGESYYGISTNPGGGYKYAALVMDDYGFIAFPHGPNGTEENVGSYTYGTRRLLGLSDKANIEVDVVGKIINFLFEPVEGYTDAMWKSELKDMVLLSEESYNNYLMIIEHPEYNFSTQLERTIDKINSALSESIQGTEAPATALSEIEESVNNNAKEISMEN